ncbi:MAG: hypothetical protein J6W11_01410 [Alphaproteobacteria bacterium]|nr:hypothetical protein [Alphaproteobacteria bacterium]MBO7097281.1 hypothetical protein [Alphaproteobacteria bacterium]
MTDMTHHILPVGQVLKEAYKYFLENEKKIHPVWLVHFVLCVALNLIPKGFANPLSLLWSVTYYVFWCVFFRIYYRKKPYLCLSKVCASAVPSTKMIFMTFGIVLLLVLLPYIPLLMGFNNKYLIVFERYMAALQAPQMSLFNVAVFSLVFLSVSPIIFCRPYLAWISSLQGYSGSIKKVFKKTKGNDMSFFYLMLLLNLPCFAVYGIDTMIGCHGWLSAAFYSIYLIYCNIVFAKVYDFFYAS